MLEQRLKDYWESRRDSVHGRLEPCCFLIRNFYGASKQSQEEPEPTRGRDPGSLRKTKCWRWARKIKEQPGRGRGRKGVQEGQTPGPGGRDTMRLRLRLRLQLRCNFHWESQAKVTMVDWAKTNEQQATR